MRLFAMSPGLIWEQIKAGIRVRSILAAGKQVPAGHSEGPYSPEQALHKAERKENVGRTQKPAGINHHDEFVPQGGVTYRQVDLSKGALMFSDGPETTIPSFVQGRFPFHVEGEPQTDRLTLGTGLPLKHRSGTRRWSSPTAGCGSRTCACSMQKLWSRCQWPAWSPGRTLGIVCASHSGRASLRSEQQGWGWRRAASAWMWRRGEGFWEAGPLGWSAALREVEEEAWGSPLVEVFPLKAPIAGWRIMK